MNNSISKLYTRKNINDSTLKSLFYLLLRFFFIFFPFSPLVVKLTGLTYWKDAAYIICFIIGIRYIINFRFIYKYCIIVLLIVLMELVQGKIYIEYITWFIMGVPLVMYLKMIRIDDFDRDCYFIGFLMIIAFLWVYFFEKGGGYEYTFMKESENFTLQRGNSIRLRFCFVSPMALSQYAWFALLLFALNNRLKKSFKIVVCLCILYLLVACNTRAGILLTLISLFVYIYSFFFSIKKWNVVVYIVSVTFILFLQIILNAQDFSSDTFLADAERIAAISRGVNQLKETFIFGLGGIYFSPRSGKVQIFENAWLPLIYCFGLLGFILFLTFLRQLVFVTDSKYVVLFSASWVIYTFIFPAIQESTAVFITWFIIGMTINLKKTIYLFSFSTTKYKNNLLIT